MSHPVTAWLVEHTSWVLNKFHLDSHGRTAYGRLHGREGHERICEFGERIMWFVPKKLRAKMDQRWRYGIFLGRSLSSDQNYIGLSSGEVVCARAIVRVVPEMRWSHEAISKISATPLTFKAGSMDKIEESTDPHAHPEPEPVDENQDVGRQSRRLKLFDADVKKYGMTDSCQRCDYLRQNKPLLARGVRHNEECREKIYEALRAAGSERVQRADMDDQSRTSTKVRKPREPPAEPNPEDKPKDVEMPEDAPSEPLPTPATPHDEPNIPEDQIDDTYNFHEEIDAEIGDRLDVDWEGEELHDGDGDHVMATLINVLQTTGVAVGDAAE